MPPPSPRSSRFPRGTLALAALLLFALFASVLLPLVLDFFAHSEKYLDANGDWISVGVDFNLRYNEICCLREGVNPFLVRNGLVPSDTYTYYLAPSSNPPKRRLDAYPPWSYTAFFWIALLPERVSWCVYYALMAVSLCVLPVFGFHLARRQGLSPPQAYLSALAALFVSFPVTACLHTGNYGIFIAAALVLFLWALQRNHRTLAAFAWAFMMVKPQTAALLAIPLLIHKEWKICLQAAAFCILAAIPAACLCHTPVWTLILEIPRFGSAVATQTKLLPATLMAMLSPVLPLSLANLISAAAGAALCAFLSWRMRASSVWVVRLLPAIVLGSYWTYSLPHNDCTLGIAQAVFSLALLLPLPSCVKRPTGICFFSVPLLHVQRLFSVENTPWTLWRLLGLSFPDSSAIVRILSVLHLLAGVLLLFSFILFSLRLARRLKPFFA